MRDGTFPAPTHARRPFHGPRRSTATMPSFARPYTILRAPSGLGLATPGVERLADTLLRLGVAERLRARRVVSVAAPVRSGERDAATGVLHGAAIARWAPLLADVIGDALDRRECPVVLGGDCSILLSAALALRRRGRFGLLFLDAHADFYQPAAEPKGEAASMELALATGHGPAPLADLEGRGPLVRTEDVVLFGLRDEADQQAHGSQPLPPDALALNLAAIRARGIDRAIADGLQRLAHPALDGFFVHLDVDCLDDEVMPAVDYRLPDGLSCDELTGVLRAALATGRVAGLDVTIYNPDLDPDGAAGRRLAALLCEALGRSARWKVAADRGSAGGH